METIHIQTESKKYDVFIGEGVRNKLSGFLNNHFNGLTKVFIITDETVAKIHLEKILDSLQQWKPVLYIAPSGEKAKTFEVYYSALSTALENHLDRKSVILSLGGGAVGDLSGFVAATFMRGIPFIQIPTTILAHDSAVGGKVAINHPLGKNMIGAFHQPEAVFYDLDLLQTLSQQEIRSGFAEVIKHSLISDSQFYNSLLRNIHNLNDLPMELLKDSLTRGIEIKGEIVSQDEKETGIRAYLNFGHTLGHAIESEMGYGNITHGESVMIGMVFAIRLSQKLLGLSFEFQEFMDWVRKLGYQIKIPAGLDPNRLINKMKQDKKTVGDSIRFVLLEQLGKPIIREISNEILLEELIAFI